MKVSPLFLIAVGGVGLYLLISHLHNDSPVSKSNFTTTHRKKDYYNIAREFADVEVPLIPRPRKNILNRIGWTVPFTHEQRIGFPPEGSIKVSNDSYSNFDDTPRDDGFAGLSYAFAGSMLPITPYGAESAPMIPVNTTDPLATAAIGNIDTIPSIIVDPGASRTIDIENQILKMIIANTTSTNVILTNIDTIKQSISTYRHKLKMAHEQMEQRNITPAQFQQFLMQVITDISTQLQLPLNARFTALMNSSPYQPVSPFM